MPANAALYLPGDDIDLTALFPDAQRSGGSLGEPVAFDVPIKGGAIRFNVMPQAQIPSHLSQFAAYIASLDEDDAAREAATRAIAAAGTVLGLDTKLEFEGNDGIAEIMEKINEHYKGCVFMFDSVVQHGNKVLVGPLKSAAS